MVGELTKKIFGLAAWIILERPMKFYFLDKDISTGSYLLNGKAVHAVPIGEVRETELEFEDFNNRKTKDTIGREMTEARFYEPGFGANAVYIRQKRGSMIKEKDITQYQPLYVARDAD